MTIAYQFCTTRRVAFAETDAAGIVHFANYFRYMEDAEHAFLRSLGLSVHAEVDGRIISWPRVHADCSFKAPLRFEEEFEIRVAVRKKSRKTITYDFLLSKESDQTVAHGTLTVVCVAVDPASGTMRATAIPESIDRKIEAASQPTTGSGANGR